MKLKEIIDNKYSEIEQSMKRLPEQKLKERALSTAKTAFNFKEALKRNSSQRLRIIAEIKRRSPSKGDIFPYNRDLVDTALQYQAGGAAAVSVLTDEKFFGGSLHQLQRVKEVIDIPVLRKDFIVHPYQVYEAKIYGADALLLIARALDYESLSGLYELTRELGMQALVEVHSEDDVEKAVRTGAEIIGINNRNLATFEIDIEKTEKLYHLIPQHIVTVSESGIKSSIDIKRLEDAGVDGALIGEVLVRAEDPCTALRSLHEGDEEYGAC